MVNQKPTMVNQKQIIETIAEILTLPPTDIDPDATLQDDLGLNPVEVADMMHEVADRFDILIEPQDSIRIKAVGDLIDLIEDKLLE